MNRKQIHFPKKRRSVWEGKVRVSKVRVRVRARVMARGRVRV